MPKLTRIVAVVALLAAVLVVTNPWRSHSERPPTESEVATLRGDEGAPARVAVGEQRDSDSPTQTPLRTTAPAEAADAVARESLPAEQDLEALVAGIDPLLRERNLITRPQDPGREGAGFEDLQSRFHAEVADSNWSQGMEARILDQVSQVIGLRLAALDAECRESVCRVKLFYPPGTDALASLEELKPIARRIGFIHVVEVATIGEDSVPISLLYFEREGV